MIEKGQYIKVIFRNSTQVEGIVESWTDKQSILLSGDNKSKFVIFNSNEDVLGVKICCEQPVKPQQKFEEVVEQFKEAQALPSEDDLRLKKMAELKALMNEQEKKIISERVKSHTISNVKHTQYAMPNFKAPYKEKK